MKKFLTVLLVIAVMFTFSFGTAFATVPWTGEATSKYLTNDTDYLADAGEEGITEAYRAELTSIAKGMLKKAKASGTFYAPEKAEAVAAIEAYLESLKTVKTAKDAAKLKADLEDKVGTWNGTEIVEKKIDISAAKDGSMYKLVSLPLQTTVKELAATAKGTTTATGKIVATEDGIALARAAAGAGTNGDATINLVKKAERAGTSDDLYLPGYVRLVKNTNFATFTDVNTPCNLKDGAAANIGAIFAATTDVSKAVVNWFMDNDYRTAGDFSTGSKAFITALVVTNTAYTEAFEKAGDAIQLEIDKYVDKADENSRKGLGLSEAEGIDALVKKITDFEKTYYGFRNGYLKVDSFKTAIANGKDNPGLAANYFDQYYSEVSAVPDVKKLTDADKANVVALYKKVMALEDSYDDVWTFVNPTADVATYTWDFDKLEKAYEHFLKKDVKAFNDLEKFTEMKKVGDKAYFDASEKNVNALKAKRAAFDALVKGYGYADLNKVAGEMRYADAAKAEALILAAEHNMGADADYDVKDNTMLQAYLNNATLKVTTKALGNTKIRVQATFDAETYKDIVAECGNDYTISYKFYHKTAKATTYKAAKEKDRNYITYTKKSLKKGTKYKFQCSVIIKDANGNVVATKDYKASTIGSRVCR